MPVAPSGRPLYIASIVLILGGLLLGLSGSSIVQLIDGLTANSQRVEVEAWVQDRAQEGPSLDGVSPEGPSPASPIARTLIVPGKDGYLLEIPAIGVRAVVRELELSVFSGKNTPLLKRYGLGQVPYTESLRNVSPGGEGTAAITGHRTSSGAPFRHIDRLRPGDVIIVSSREATQEWEVVSSVTVLPSAVEAIRSRPGSRSLVILACTPPFSAAERLIVYAKLKREAVRVGAVEEADIVRPIEHGGVR